MAFNDARLDAVESLLTEDACSGSHRVPTSLRQRQGKGGDSPNVAAALVQLHDQRRHMISNVVIDRLSADGASTLA